MQEHGARPDVRGLDSLGDVPVMLTETNYFGTPEERIAWHRQMVAEYSRQRG
jgi:hypothetical protein